jgi:hypothetical protein
VVEPSRFDQALACDREAAEHDKSGTFGSFGAAEPKEPPPA